MYRDRGKGRENLIDKRDENKNKIVKRKIKQNRANSNYMEKKAKIIKKMKQTWTINIDSIR